MRRVALSVYDTSIFSNPNHISWVRGMQYEMQRAKYTSLRCAGNNISILINPQAPDGVYKPPHVYCRMEFLNTLPFPELHLSRNAAIVSESLKVSDQRMAKRY